MARIRKDFERDRFAADEQAAFRLSIGKAGEAGDQSGPWISRSSRRNWAETIPARAVQGAGFKRCRMKSNCF